MSDEDENASQTNRRQRVEASDASDVSEAESDDLCEDEEPSYLSPSEKDWATADKSLRAPKHGLSTEVYGMEFMRIPDDRVFTMDAVSKCWKTVQSGADSLLANETEGGSWFFCEACVAQIPKNLQSCLYFFHMLRGSIDDYKYYAVPSKNVLLRRKRGDKSRISDMIWNRIADEAARAPPRACDDLDLNDVMCDRTRKNSRARNLTVRVPPFKVRLGFTGAVFRHGGEEHRKLVAVVAVTWARNWDMLGYIQDCFLSEPCKRQVNYKRKMDMCKRMTFIWKSLLRFVAFDNLGLDETRCGMPEEYSDQPGGKLGCDSLLNMFQIPFQIYGMIKQELLVKARRSDPRLTLKDIHLDSLDVVGLPRLSFRRDETVHDYIIYMHAYVNNLSNERIGLGQAIRKYYKPKEKGEAAPDEEALVSTFDFPFPGAWPLEDTDGVYTKFGMPPLAIWLDWKPEFTPDEDSNFDNWLADMGGANGIPELVKTCLRSFLVQDLAADQETIWRTWDHFLRDKRPANPSLVLREYYGDKADPLGSLMTSGYLRSWWLGVQKDIASQRERGLSVVDAAASLKRYLLSSIYHHVSSIHCGSYRSPRIVQAYTVIERSEYRATCLSDDPASIRSFARALNEHLSRDRAFDPYVRANEAFWRCFEVLNEDYLMNSSNLEFMIEVMVSQLQWMFGPNNETVVAYFQGLYQMAGNGHFFLTTKDGVFRDRRKPNNTGADWMHGRVTETFQMKLDDVGIMDPNQNLQTPMNCMGWTPASIPLLTNATITDGQIESLPDPMFGLRSLIATEIRGDSMDMLIRGVFPRNSDGQKQCMFNTADPEKTNQRKTQIKRRFADLQFVSLMSNVPDTRAEDAERTKTLMTVMHVMPPGSGPHTRKQRTGAFNNLTCNAFGGRQTRPKKREAIGNLLPFTHIWATALPSLMNMTNVIPAEISPTSLAFLDWLFCYVKEATDGMLEKTVSEGFKRMKDGYEARGVAKSLWVKTIMFLGQCESHDDALQRILLSLYSNALPGHEVVAVVHSFLTRGLHMGTLLVISCIAKHLEVPIIPLESLCEFFDQEEAPAPNSGEARRTFELIYAWLLKCLQRNRFCPENLGVVNPYSNVSIYITSDGDESGLPPSERDALLRIKRGKIQDEVHHAIGKRVKDIWGRPLFETCHMGPEPSVYANAIHEMLVHWLPDCRQLFSAHLFSSRRHLAKLGLQVHLPMIEDWPVDAERPPQFARVFSVYSPNGTPVILPVDVHLELQPIRLTHGALQDPVATCVGVHAFALLFCVSLAGGPCLHPKITSNVARSLLRAILGHAPPCATPGNNFIVRSFNLHTTVVERVIVPRVQRPLHFPRPLEDWSFANTGKFTYCRAIGRFLPEDAGHCGALFAYASLFKCDVLDLPAREIQVEYELMGNTHYAAWRPRDKAFGSLIVHTRDNHVTLGLFEPDSGDGTDYQWDTEEWPDALREHELILPPMIWRSGACVRVETRDGEARVGCLVPTDGCNYIAHDCSYMAVCRPGGARKRLHFAKVLETLLPVGTEVFVKLASQPQLRVSSGEAARPLLSARLNAPTVEDPEPGKVYVTCMQKPVLARTDASEISCVTLVLDPWDLELEAEDPSDVVRYLVSA